MCQAGARTLGGADVPSFGMSAVPCERRIHRHKKASRRMRHPRYLGKRYLTPFSPRCINRYRLYPDNKAVVAHIATSATYAPPEGG
jgi:hypothetical protein